MSEYKYLITDISGKEPIEPPTLHRLERVRRRDITVEVYVDEDGRYWPANSEHIRVEVVE
jgi:hypothetical protein